MSYWTWRDVDPTTHPFDPAPVRAIADACVIVGGDRGAIEENIDRALIATYGMWAAGWRWAASEPGCGGLVRAWCCAADSLLQPREPRVRSIEMVVAAVADWRAVLEQLSILFAEMRAANASAEQAATRLLPLVVERTECNDVWYATYATVLSWYLESTGLGDASIRAAIRQAIDGRFGSWIEPDEYVTGDVLRAVGVAVEKAAQTEIVPRDALTEWLLHRDEPILHIQTNGVRLPVTRDAHRHWIDSIDEARDARRAAGMRAALDACRLSARSGEPLSFEVLASWQQLVLGIDAADFRTTQAFAKGGRERYAIANDTKQRFVAALADANAAEPAPTIRAARVYLDVCFFHPFADGNARAARLALDHVLTRAGLALHHVEPVFVVSRETDRRAVWNLASVIDHLAGPPRE